MQLLALLCAALIGLSIPFPGRGARVLTALPAWEYSHAIWSKDGHRLLYIDPAFHVQLLDLRSRQQSKQLTTERATDATWSPDEQRIAYTADRPEGDYFVNTIYVKPVAGGEPIDLLPGELAVSSVSTQKRVDGWFADDVLAYEEHMGTALQQLFLLDMKRQDRYTDEKLMASYFVWDEQKRHVAGQWVGSDPAWFWLWDRKERRFITPTQPLPGHGQYFEAWSPDGSALLFTAWDRGGFYGDLGAQATLYRLEVESGQVTKVADQAGLATWAGDGITYVKLEERMSLVVNDPEGRERWRTDLGELAKVQQKLPGLYRPVAATTFLSYRRADDSWWVSPVTKEPHLLFRGPAKAADWTPFGRYLAIHRPRGARTERTQLQVLENPLAPGNQALP